MHDQHSWLKITASLIGRLLLCAAISYLGYYLGGLVGGILSTAAWGVMFAKPIIAFSSWYYRSATQFSLKKYNGNYYEFANTQIRIFVVANKLWCVDTDVLKVIGQKPNVMLESLYTASEYDQITGTTFNGFSEEGMEKLLEKSTHFEALRMLYWFRRDVKKPHYRKLEIAKELTQKKLSTP